MNWPPTFQGPTSGQFRRRTRLCNQHYRENDDKDNWATGTTATMTTTMMIIIIIIMALVVVPVDSVRRAPFASDPRRATTMGRPEDDKL